MLLPVMTEPLPLPATPWSWTVMKMKRPVKPLMIKDIPLPATKTTKRDAHGGTEMTG
jgi:hypothetical protein